LRLLRAPDKNVFGVKITVRYVRLPVARVQIVDAFGTETQ
jgi:hypothetical protein